MQSHSTSTIILRQKSRSPGNMMWYMIDTGIPATGTGIRDALRKNTARMESEETKLPGERIVRQGLSGRFFGYVFE